MACDLIAFSKLPRHSDDVASNNVGLTSQTKDASEHFCVDSKAIDSSVAKIGHRPCECTNRPCECTGKMK